MDFDWWALQGDMGLFGCLRRQQGQSIKPTWIFFPFILRKKRECLMEQQIQNVAFCKFTFKIRFWILHALIIKLFALSRQLTILKKKKYFFSHPFILKSFWKCVLWAITNNFLRETNKQRYKNMPLFFCVC